MVNKNKLPESAYPKPGEDVVWFFKNTKIEGKLIGYNTDEIPVITNQFTLPDLTATFDIIRPKFPNNRIKPNWKRIPKKGKLLKCPKKLYDAILDKLNERIPPGPSYYEFIEEVYSRGYEIYLVGGTIRDFLQGIDSNDIDLVTTIPLKSAHPLLKSMFNDNFSYKKENGFIRIGGRPQSGDPFIDLKNFNLCNTGVFGSELENDFKNRDFACNALYFDPINKNIIDPSGKGVEDAKNKKLTLVKDSNIHNTSYSSAQILIRYIKFLSRGYNSSKKTLEIIKQKYCRLFTAMDAITRMRYINAQILSKHPIEKRNEEYSKFVKTMLDLGFTKEYVKFIKPFENLLKID